eukprot:403351687
MQYRHKLVPLLQDMFQRFYQFRNVWNNAVHCMAELDALCALAMISNEKGMVRPIVHSQIEKPFIQIEGMRHPCIILQQKGKEFVANDVDIDYDKQRALLITGPNMGGKSTLLRSTCLIIILAQVGCFVPAQTCEFTIVDQIYTRIGASDRILENLSTFKLELSETKSIVDNANKNSLVIMDELGRGTSTFDGYAIAHSVLNYLLKEKKCRLLFTTHYHWLVDDFKEVPGVALYHMSIEETNLISPHKDLQIDQQNNSPVDEDKSNQSSAPTSHQDSGSSTPVLEKFSPVDPTITSTNTPPIKKKRGRKPKSKTINTDSTYILQSSTRKVKFLFKFVPGTAQGSFGLCVGEMAGLPKILLDKAELKSLWFSKELDRLRRCKSLPNLEQNLDLQTIKEICMEDEDVEDEEIQKENQINDASNIGLQVDNISIDEHQIASTSNFMEMD